MKTRRIGILGGTFDPIHCGHLDLGRAARAALGLTEMFVVTSNIPPHRPQPAASSCHRFAMVALAIGGLEHWRASDVELAAGGPSFTSGTLQRFHDDGCAAADLFFVVGADAFAEVESWNDYPAILDRANFVVVSRPGFPISELALRLPALGRRMASAFDTTPASAPLIFLLDARTANVSATDIRDRCAAGESIAGLVPAGVAQHIEQHALYSSSSTGPLGEFAHDARRPPAAGRLHGQN
jgi:nicotinate-nucleotide adenylyltransferase